MWTTFRILLLISAAVQDPTFANTRMLVAASEVPILFFPLHSHCLCSSQSPPHAECCRHLSSLCAWLLHCFHGHGLVLACLHVFCYEMLFSWILLSLLSPHLMLKKLKLWLFYFKWGILTHFLDASLLPHLKFIYLYCSRNRRADWGVLGYKNKDISVVFFLITWILYTTSFWEVVHSRTWQKFCFLGNKLKHWKKKSWK